MKQHDWNQTENEEWRKMRSQRWSQGGGPDGTERVEYFKHLKALSNWYFLFVLLLFLLLKLLFPSTTSSNAYCEPQGIETSLFESTFLPAVWTQQALP